MERTEQPKPTKAERAYERLMQTRKMFRKANAKKPFDDDVDEPYDHELMEFLEELHRPKDKTAIDLAAEMKFVSPMFDESDMIISEERKQEMRAALIELRKSAQEK